MAALLSGRRPVEVGFPTVERRVDLRGIVIPEPEALRSWAGMGAGRVLERVGDSLNLGAIQLSWVDLGHGFLPHLRLRSAALTQCRFDGATLPDLRTSDTVFERCGFAGTDLGGATLGPGTRFLDCDFTGARLRGLSTDCASFAGCDFAGAVLADSDYNRTVFERCRFAGLLSDVRFRAESFNLDPALGRVERPDPDCLRDCDFSEATLEQVTFNQLVLRGVKLPSGGSQLLLEDLRCVLDRILHEVAEDDQRIVCQRLRTRAGYELKHLPRGRSWGHLNLDDVRRGLPGDEATFGVQIVERAVAACASRRKGWFGLGR